MKLSCTLAATPLSTGLMKKGAGELATLLNTSVISSGGIAEPSAKCSQ